ncbi:MAG: hypothetical protein RL141_497 [Candidatus Parcubacteria bacterium]|jgi:hypothetical protein
MKKALALLLPALVLFGQGCPIDLGGNQVPSDTPTTPSNPQAIQTGCSPKTISVLSPLPGSTHSLPVTVSVLVENDKNPNCIWTLFEAQAGSVQLYDRTGAEVGSGSLVTTQNWMTTGPVGFSVVIDSAMVVPPGEAHIVITEEDPSGMGDVQTIEVPFNLQ